ncbi:hypothetical protein [Streptomyces sp. NPDC048419]|uniref:hypothetical protein n=1 Tax=Streptomyces sp. NPDC048419 TaxID=3365547 RepID=UPI0037209BB3
MSLLNAKGLYIAKGGSIVPVLFSLGRVFTLGLLAVAALALPAWQHHAPGAPLAVRAAPLPGWSKPPLAVLGSSWRGIGAGLLIRPGFWAAVVPWDTGRADAQAPGVCALALGVGVLGSLAEDDPDRTRPALLALSLVCMVAGPLCAGGSGRVLLARSSAVTRGT